MGSITNQLETIVIQYPFKRHVIETNNDNIKKADSFGEVEEISGDYFVIPFDQVININITYLTLQDFNDTDKISEYEVSDTTEKTSEADPTKSLL